jgi:hypothetical protein
MIKDALKYLEPNAVIPIDMETTIALVNALKERLAQPEQEPVAVVDVHEFYDNCANFSLLQKLAKGKHTLYTTSPQRKPLTDEEIFALENSIPDEVVSDRDWCIHFARAIEAKLKENT